MNRTRKLDFVPSPWTGILGLLGLIGGTVWMALSREPVWLSGIIVGLMTATPMVVHDLVRFGPPRPAWKRADTGRVFVKYLGLLATLGLVGLVYLTFPEYRNSAESSTFYFNFWLALQAVVPVVLALGPFYIRWIDRRMAEPRDGYWAMGMACLLRLPASHRPVLKQHLLGWAVKGFFLPLMFSYFCMNLNFIRHHEFPSFLPFQNFFDYWNNYLFTIDLGFVTVGYCLTFKLFNSHIRSTEPTISGWLAALLCYQPFWSTIERQYIQYNYAGAWGGWLYDFHPLYEIWGSAILLLVAAFVWATVPFGLRFSNLTHRGIVIWGPYSYTKHPAYISKLVSFLMIGVPFLAYDGFLPALRRCALLGLLALVYVWRARTEERHLGMDRTYRVYARWIGLRQRRFFAKLLFRRYREGLARGPGRALPNP